MTRPITMLSLDKIRTDGGTQPRGKIDYLQVQDYQEAYKRGDQFPPVVVFYDGESYWLADGYHRFTAIPIIGKHEIAADIRQGTQSDAVWFSCGANATHGLPRSSNDKRRAITTALQHPKSKDLSDRAIAQHCGVDHKTVAAVRAELSPGEIPQQPRKGRDGKTYQPPKKKAKPRKPRSRVDIIESDEPYVAAEDDSFASDASDPKEYLAYYLIRADQARQFAKYVGPLEGKFYEEVIPQAEWVAKTWATLAAELKSRRDGDAAPAATTPTPVEPVIDDPLCLNLGRKFWSDLKEMLQRKAVIDIGIVNRLSELIGHFDLDYAIKDFVAAQELAFTDLRRACNRARERARREKREAVERAKLDAEHLRRMAEDPAYAAHQREIDRLIAEARRAFGGFFSHAGPAKYDEACKLLGLPDYTGEVTVESARRAYHALARAHHPDLGGDVAKMTEINLAYNIVMTELEGGQ